MVASVWTGVGFLKKKYPTRIRIKKFWNRSGVEVWKTDSGHLCNAAEVFGLWFFGSGVKRKFWFAKFLTSHQRWSDSGFSLSDPNLFSKNDIRIRSESCFGWNHTIRIRKLSENVLWCTTYILCCAYFALLGKITAGAILPLAQHKWLK